MQKHFNYTDTTSIICNGERISSDVSHFEVFPYVCSLSKDSHTVFRNCHPFLEADAQSFELLPVDYYCGELPRSSDFYAWDNNYVYRDGMILCDRKDALKTDLNYYYALNNKIYEGQSFPDIQNYLYKKSVEELHRLGVVTGYGDGLYRPNRIMSRAEFLKVVLSLESNYDPGKFDYPTQEDLGCFPDLGEDGLAAHVCYAASKGFVHGYNDGFFRTNHQFKL